jgi:glycine/D-amino acid oxidase-like deaminating enzyme
MIVDFIIVGQGICGTLLSWNFIKAGRTVLVIDKASPFSASRVASGIINPVTGRRIVRTWRIEEVLPFAQAAYQQLERELQVKILSNTSVLDFHPTLQMKDAFENRMPEEQDYLHQVKNEVNWKAFFNFNYGIGEVAPCLLVDLHSLLNSWRNKLQEQHALLDEKFSIADCKVEEDKVMYKDVTASKIFFCDGVSGFDNPYFYQLPYSHMKGEALIVSIPRLSPKHIYKHGFTIAPWQDDLFWIGSSYEWKFADLQPTTAFRQKAEAFLRQFVKLPYVVEDHIAADRPANMERRPFVGLHPNHDAVGILNGMGTKGCSLAPFFSKQLVDHVLHGSAIYPDANVRRFQKVLNRTLQ